jgi:hypothetical protein
MKNSKKLVAIYLTLLLIGCSDAASNKVASTESSPNPSGNSKKEALSKTAYYEETPYPAMEISSVLLDNEPTVMYSMSAASDNVSSNAPQSSSSTTSPSKITSFDQKLIKTGNLSYRVNNLFTERQRINQIINTTLSYISNETQDNQSGKNSQYLTIRIPAEHFDKFMEQLIDGVKVFDYKNIYVEDVTDQYTDLESRISTKKAIEIKYIALLDRAKTIAEILEIERQIGFLRTDIEAAEARFKTISNQIAYSTLDITIYELEENPVVYEEPSVWSDAGDAFAKGWDSVIQFFINLIQSWPSLLIVLVIFIIVKRKWRSWRDKLTVKSENSK